MVIYPVKQSLTITVREAAALSSFPIEFSFQESVAYNYKMIGNAVPPLLERGI
jgi:DNA (cytosine-5)-methyltransferase 1